MRNRYSRRGVAERNRPIHLWVALGMLLILSIAFAMAEGPTEAVVPQPEPESREVVTPLGGGVGCDTPNNTLENCGFEDGDFSSWGTQDLNTPFISLQVSQAGFDPGFGLFVSEPTEGDFAAIHGWDGDGPGTIKIFQDNVVIPVGTGTPVLQFDFRAGFDLASFGALLDREFSVTIEPDGGGTPFLEVLVATAEAGVFNGDTGVLSDSIDLSGLGLEGTFVRVSFNWLVPELNSGPAFFQVDNVVLSTLTCANGIIESCNCANGGNGLGCDDQDCEDFVCAVDAFCCNTDWDGICDGEALFMCSCTANEDCDDGNLEDGDCCSSACTEAGDVNGSDRVDGFDLSVVAQALGLTGPPEADIVPDGIIDGMDVDELTEFFGCEFVPDPAP